MTTTVHFLSVYNRQKEGLLSMLSACTTAADSFEDSEDVWKVLIYDFVGRDILAPLLSVAELRSAGVTLHLLLHNVRHAIPDVPSVYFIEPTMQNVLRVASDAAKGVYSSLWINFTDCASREILEILAENVATMMRANPFNGRIGRVYDMYTNFHSLQHNLFSLDLPNMYSALNSTKVTNAQVETLVAKIVERLFCVVVTLGTVPFIRAQKGGAANLVATMLDARIREQLKASHTTLSKGHDGGGGAFITTPSERPLLVIVDRALDLPIMLHQTWTYQALVHDVLGLRLNRVTVTLKEGEGAIPAEVGKRTFDLDQTDMFWTQHAGLPFPMVAEAVEGALQIYRDEVAELNRSAGVFGSDDHLSHPAHSSLGDQRTTDKLAAAVSNIPELARKKRIIDLHTNIATALLDEIKERGLDGYFQLEEELLSRPGNFDVERILALLTDSKGRISDKLRLFLMYYLCVDNATEREMNRCIDVLKMSGCEDFRAYAYIKRVKTFTRSISTTSVTPLSTASSGIGGAYAASVLDTLSQVANNVNKLILATDKGFAMAHDVRALMDSKVDTEVAERYMFLDPKQPKGSSGSAPGSVEGGRGHMNAIVFVVGPGNYIEFQNCQDYVCSRVVQEGKQKRRVRNEKTVVYGATELCTGVEFLQQLQANGDQERVDV